MATTELNKVEGFDPKQYARTIQDANGQESLYLDVQYRKMWFRLCNPTGKIVKKICTFDGNLAVVEARIYLDRNDAPENFVSNAFAQRFVDPNNPEYGTRYLESAETAAVGRALADAGYGLQFCMEPDPTPVDMGQTPFAMAPDAFDDPEPFTPVPTGVNGNYSVNTAAQSNRPAPQPVQQQQYQPPQSQPQNVQQYNANRYHAPVQPQAPSFTHQTPVDEIVRLMPYEEAVKVVYRCNGKHNGMKTFAPSSGSLIHTTATKICSRVLQRSFLTGTREDSEMLYIITISSNYIRDAQYADTFGLSDSEVREDIFMDSDLDERWKDFYPEHFLCVVEADSKENAIENACRIKKHDPRILAAYSVEDAKL